ncbi:hypothetical protein KGM_206455 [Danaus plexippus plexippus]|uniref:Uncharacterized protein n=1 Tax=Danaus plexippus plexippus TaxID=278856 RepID=A0A212EQR8_DANPL|nr:hypothetical protein KGM_206455 [Danaus plexippus plexippus]
MSRTPSRNVDSLNYFIPKELPTINKEGSPVSKTVYMHLSKLHSFLNDWLSLKVKGVKICKSISALKLYECFDDYYPHQTQPLTEGLLESLSGFENIVEENVAHCRDENLIEVYVSAWEFEAYFNMDTCAYLFAEIGLTGIT